MNLIIPDNEYSISFARSGGKGGQNVNKVSTKAILSWDVYNSRTLSSDQKYLVIHHLENRINEKGELILWSQSERSQLQNKSKVIAKLNWLVNKALTPQIPRIATRPTRSSKEKRILGKKLISAKKSLRKLKHTSYE